jgi:nucleoid-associated protein YgaU
VLAHHEWAPTRKEDPAGPSRFGSVNPSKSWDMDAFRRDVNAKRGSTEALPVLNRAQPAVATYVVQAGDAWWSIAAKTMGDPAHNWTVLADGNGGRDRVLHPGSVHALPGPPRAYQRSQAKPKKVPPETSCWPGRRRSSLGA